jgi:2-iminobutanoate/2-iminopropanoate deaminase
MRNIRACLEAGGSSLEKVVRRRIYIIDIKQFREVDAIWAEWVGPPYPVSTCVQVKFPFCSLGSADGKAPC